MMPASMSNEADIQWGTIKDRGNKARILYSSVFSEGREYKLYDNVEVYSADHSEPYIGKIMKLWEEKESGMRRVLIRWFFKLRDLDSDMEGDPKELFLAFGMGKGVTNENDVEVICGKCKVLCTSKDVRNRQPSAEDLKDADFFFSKIYNVDRQHLSPVQRIVDKLGCEAVYNKQEWVTEISKSNEKTGEESKAVQDCKRDATVKQEAQCMGSSLSDSKDRQGDLGTALQNSCEGSNFKRHQTSTTDEVLRSKRLKTTPLTSPSIKVAPANGLQKTQKVSSSGDVISTSKISTDSPGMLVPPIKVDGQEEHSKMALPACVPPQIKSKALNFEKDLSSRKFSAGETTLRKVDDAFEQKNVANTIRSRQIDEKGRSDLNWTEEACIDNQEIKEDNLERSTDSLRQAEGASGLVEGEKLFEKKEINKFVNTLNAKREAEGIVQADCKIIVSLDKKSDQGKVNFSLLQEPGNPCKGPVKEVRSDVPKKADMEKKLIAAEKRKIFKELPWEENLQQGILYEKVLLLQNFDPFFTSADVRDMLKNILQGISDARIIPQETTCPYGQALAIFDSKLLADSALQEMERKCLVVADNKRPIIASKVKEPSNVSRFPGHLALEKLKLSRNLVAEEYTKAVSTSHCSQPNTIEYEMAMEWRRLQEIIQTCQVELFEKQRKEMEEMSTKKCR